METIIRAGLASFQVLTVQEVPRLILRPREISVLGLDCSNIETRLVSLIRELLGWYGITSQ